MKKYALSICCMVFFGIFILNGCGVKKDYIMIDYSIPSNTQALNGADKVTVKVLTIDDRKDKTNVGKKGNEYSFLGAIIPQNDITDVVTKAILSELQNRGFLIGDTGIQVISKISKFYNEFKGFPEQSVSEVIMNIQVKNEADQILFSKNFTGEGVNAVRVLRTGAGAKVALEAALKDALRQLFEDKDFIKALLQSD